MKKVLAVSIFVYLTVFESLSGWMTTNKNAPFVATARAQDYSPSDLFSADQLDNLLAPIALYPDPLLAQVLPAATFVDQIDEAARWMRAYNDPDAVDDQPWEVSVRAVAHYPTVLYMMSDRINWTTSLGQAYVYQSTDVMTSIQRLRALAYSAGDLVSGQQQQVLVEGNYIRIVPFQPQFIYVPTYDPALVYVQRSYAGPDVASLISFGAGLAIGAWLNSDCDWEGRRIYYHGWQGNGWIARSRPIIHITNVYVNNNYRNIQINRDVVHRTVNYNALNRFASVHREVNYNSLARGPRPNPGNPNLGNKIIRRNVDVNDPRIDRFRGHPPAPQQATRSESPSSPRPAPLPARQERPPPPQARPQPAPPPQREAPQLARPLPQQPPSNVQRPSPSVFANNRSGLDPRAVSQRGQASRAQANRPAERPAPTAPNPAANRPNRPEPRGRQQ